MKLTQSTSQKLHSNDLLPQTAHIRYDAHSSQPQEEVTAHRDVRRRSPRDEAPSWSPRLEGLACPARATLATLVMLLSGAGSLSCRHAPAPAPGPRTAVQVLIQAGPVINPGDDGQPWPTAVTLYQLRGDPDAPEHAPLDSAAVLSRGDAAFGELLLERREYTAFPDTRARVVVPLGPETTHLVAVAHFREPLGDAALLVFPVPDRRTADPCLYLGLERSELDGGPFPPPGFDPAAFATTCPPPAAPKQPVPADSKPAPVPPDSPTAPPRPPVPPDSHTVSRRPSPPLRTAAAPSRPPVPPDSPAIPAGAAP